jgi:gliding motility-associated-like protein
LADLEVTADGGPSGMNTLHYYASVSAYQAGNELPSSTLLTNGMTVVISQTTPNGCESIDLLTVVVTLTPPPAAPLAATPQLFCSVEAKTVGDLAVTALAGYSVTWYDAATGGNVLASSALLATGNYYASQTSPEGCESVARAMVSVTVTPTPLAPTGAATQTFCASSYPTVASLVAVPTSPNTVITWYNAVGVALAGNTVLQNGVHYYATQTSSAAPYCESVAKLDVEVVIVSVPVPTGDVSQDFCVGDEARVAQLVVSVSQGYTVVWYNAATGGTVVTASTLLQNGIYYAEAQNANGCTSLTRLAVEVILNPDCDGDGVLDVQEVDGDTDGDGYVDYLDPNDDDDSLNTIDEDSNNDGNWFNDDCNDNGIVDYLDPQPCDFVPNAFSPGVNEDGFNDTWVIPALAQYPNFTLEVYDRWGNIVYEYKNEGSVQPQWWDGISNGRWNYKEGEILPTGTYFYIIDFNDGTREPITGWVYLQAQNN